MSNQNNAAVMMEMYKEVMRDLEVLKIEFEKMKAENMELKLQAVAKVNEYTERIARLYKANKKLRKENEMLKEKIKKLEEARTFEFKLPENFWEDILKGEDENEY